MPRPVHPAPVAPPAGLSDPVTPGGHISAGAADRPAAGLAVALAVLLVAELVVRAVTGGSPPPLRFHDHVTAVRAERMQTHGPAEVVFAGTSMAWQGMIPAVFTAADPASRAAFNAGLDGAVPMVSGPWLRDHVVPALSPRTVVWGLSTLDLAPAYGTTQEQTWQRSPAGRPGPLGAIERWAAAGSELVARRSRLRRPALLSGPPEATGDAGSATTAADAQKITGPDGQRIGLTGDRTAQGAAVQRARLAGFDPDMTDVHAIAETVLALAGRGIEVVLAELPVPPSLAELHPRGSADVALGRQVMTTLAEVLQVRFVPASDGWQDEDFIDWTHLTAQGAGRFTTELAAQMPLVAVQPVPEHVADGDEAADRARPDPAATAPSPSPIVAEVTATAPDVSAAGATAIPAAEPPAAAAPTTPQPTAAPPPPSVATGDWVGGPSARAVGEVVRLAAVTQVGCAGAGVPAEVVQAAHDGIADLADRILADALSGLVARSSELDTACGEQAQWTLAMGRILQASEDVARLLEAEAGVEQTPAGAVQAALAGATPRDLAIFASHTHDRLHWLLRGAMHPRLSRNPVWWSYAQRGHVDALLRTVEEAGSIDTVVFGTSQARTGILPGRLAQATGRTVFNAAVDGGTIDVTEVWARDFVLDTARPQRAVVLVSGIDILTSVGPPCPTSALQGLQQSMAVARASFAGVPWLQGTAPLRVASAFEGSTTRPPLWSPLAEGYRAGPAEDYRPRSQEEAVRQGRSYLAAYESFTYCPDRFDALERLVGGMVGRGIEVLVVAAPIRSELRDVAPPDTVSHLDRTLRQVTEEAGGRFIAATTFMADADMIDLVHVSEQGAGLLTDHVAAALEAR